ncbi:MAG: hypothetical protein KKI13_03625 [Candidatus Omnitrophica bacterium]|nr:hypothetical protein [Candidatus Omnitrophota bacterium]MCG2704525.1 hypothetical protein [Candidatus Omnitrophota bacterium]
METEKLNNILKDYFSAKIKLPEKSSDCPPLETLARYASGGLHGQESYNVGNHVKRCAFCSELVEGAFLYSAYAKEIKLEDVSARMKKRAKSLNPAYTEKEHKFMSYLKKKIWFILSLTSFIASFFVPRYFLQFLALAIILGLKWVFNKETTRTLIMVYNAWKKHDKEGKEDLDEIFKNRL